MAEGGKSKQRKAKHNNVENNHESSSQHSQDDVAANMSEEGNRQIRDKYRELIQNAKEKADGAGSAGIDTDSVRQMVLLANEAFTRVKRPREAAMDAQFLKTCGTLAKLNIESAQSNLSVFKPTEFAQKLILFMAQDEEEESGDLDQPDWERFGKAVSSLYKRTVGVEPLYGALEWQRPKPAPRARNQQKDSEAGPKIKPKQVLTASTGEEKQTEEVTRIYNVLVNCYKKNDKYPICFYTFVVNPHCFNLTTENLFHTSFLLREQRAIIDADENGLPVIAPRSISAPRIEGVSHQSLITLTKREWRKIVESFKITGTMIPSPEKRSLKRKT
ncbi:non-structural maintenance of chromosomes element 4 homolog A isoform X2 [Procambarus clarkii]|uniref:non-structural maintenance of chromosomes element 4 homolog A isoform X2 n=1 Tax=Procambarus clarkii TaxID=6728 RepID=UPI001E672301|nr:non-structural maintenance of chromosomes element 4 homolog A-like isoform X2 [Procambarus clarkii]XP_045606350.1 non-structural maintenance of chromosomes element 4 homolog A-like isoform X2 [Procambarus clarkii]